MKKVIILLLTVFALTSLYGQKQPITKPNYKLASRFSPNKLKRMVFSTRVNATWLSKSNRFWYKWKDSNQEYYYIVNAERNSKKLIFDNAGMAAMLTEIVKDPFDAQHLPIEDLKFTDDEKSVRFKITSSQMEEDTTSVKKEKSETEKKDGVEKDKKDSDKKKKDKKKDKKPKKKKKVFYFEYNLSSKKLTVLKDYKEPKEDPRWANISPDGEIVLYSKNYNLYWMDKENYKKALEDEKDTTIVDNKITDDGEEFYSYGYIRRGENNVTKEKNKDKRRPVYGNWSHDSKKFAFVRTDERKVKELWVIKNTDSPRPTLESYKYQMPGEKEAPIYELDVLDLDSKEITKMKADKHADQTISLAYLPSTNKSRLEKYTPSKWISKSSSKLYFTRTSRDLKKIDLCVADPSTGEVKTLIEESMNTSIEQKSFRLVNNEKEIIWWSERDGWAHFYLYSADGKLKNRITKGPWHCDGIVNVDQNEGVLYFRGNGKEKDEDPYYYHFYRVNLNGSGLRLLNKGNFNHSFRMSDDCKYFVNNYSRVNTVPKADLMDNRGNKVLALEEADLSQLFAAGYKFPEPFKAKAADGITDIYGVIYKPFNFDSTKIYPLLEYVYPGPQTEAVNKSFSARMDRTDRMAQLGFVVITLGNRGGHPNRSKWYHNYGYGNLRDYGLADKKYVAEQLADRFDFIDINKVGIYGHSGGGFMSTAAMLVYPDFFKVAVSAAGNHTNNIYNRWWSEKHHGVEEIIKNGETKFLYDIEKNPSLAKNLKGKLMLVTGDIDNNVHPANTIRMADALIKANKRFDFFIYPGQRHGFGKMREYSFWIKADYFCEHLIGWKPESVDRIEMNNEVEQSWDKKKRK